jgi:adenylate cyclase class IV
VARGRASVAFQGLGVLARFIELERKVDETRELREKVAELEELARQVSHQPDGTTLKRYR